MISHALDNAHIKIDELSFAILFYFGSILLTSSSSSFLYSTPIIIITCLSFESKNEILFIIFLRDRFQFQKKANEL